MIVPKLSRITLKKHKAIWENTTLDSLGHINVFCGKNNTGKTSTLEAISQSYLESGVRTYFKISYTYILQILDKYKQKKKGFKFGESEVYNDIIRIVQNEKREIVAEYLFNNHDVYGNEVIFFFNGCMEEYMEKKEMNMKPILYNELTKELIKFSFDIFQEYIMKNQKTAYIPPKRNPSTEVDIFNSEPKDKIFHKNSYLLQFLFNAKNKPLNNDFFKSYVELQNTFQEVSNGFNFNIVMDIRKEGETGVNLQLQFGDINNQWLSANDSGSGLQDLLIILSYIVFDENMIVLLEEPENHLHPEIQRRLLNYLKTRKDKQFFITTHSNVFLDTLYVDAIFHTKIENGVAVISNASKKAEVLKDLGYSVYDNLVADLVILVEGKTDKPVLEEFLMKMDIWGKYNIKIWALGGNNMEHQDLSVLTESYSKERIMALVDKDDESKKTREKFIENCNSLGVKYTLLERYAIENYFTSKAIKKAFPSKEHLVPEIIDTKNKIDIPEIGKHLKSKNGYIASFMSIQDIEGTDDLYEFLKKVKSKLENEK